MEKIPYKLIRSRWKTLGLELRTEGLVVCAPLRATNRQVEYNIICGAAPAVDPAASGTAEAACGGFPTLTEAKLKALAGHPGAGMVGLWLYYYPLPEVPAGQLFQQREPQL